MCDRKDRLASADADVVPVEWAKVWSVLLSRHATCQPSEACVVDATLTATGSKWEM